MAPERHPALTEIGARVRARRRELGLSQEALADRAGLHWTFVGQVERGRRNLSVLNLLKLADALERDPGALIAGQHAGQLDAHSGADGGETTT